MTDSDTLTICIGGPLLLYILFKLVSFTRLYTHARRSGFPIFISPVPSKNILWMVIAPMLQSILERYLPIRIYERLDLAIYGWEYRRKAEVHGKLGKVFVLLTLDECVLWVADPAIAHVILQRRKDFLQPPIVEKVMGVFGSNVIASNGADWQRQRRIFAPNLNERISESVWNESCRQAQSMNTYLLDHPGNQTLSGLRCVAINVLGLAGYGQKQEWAPDFQSLARNIQGERGLYFKAISLAAEMLLEAALIPAALLKLWFMPSRLQLLGYHKEKIPTYTNAILEMARNTPADDSRIQKSFLKMLVKCSDDAKGLGTSGLSLTDDEISGNLFVFSIAGFETTANTMGYAVTLLAIYPEWQTWIREEIQDLPSDPLAWKYDEVFPRSKRILAIMFETLRLFTSVMHATRSISEPQQLAGAATSHLLLPPMDIFISMQIMNGDPDIWGPSCFDFNPSRWIDSDGELVSPPKGTFMPWSGGPRICPGMKMAQVEFVATIATLFRSAGCEPIPLGSENAADARRRLRGLIENPMAQVALSIRCPEKVNLRWADISTRSLTTVEEDITIVPS